MMKKIIFTMALLLAMLPTQSFFASADTLIFNYDVTVTPTSVTVGDTVTLTATNINESMTYFEVYTAYGHDIDILINEVIVATGEIVGGEVRQSIVIDDVNITVVSIRFWDSEEKNHGVGGQLSPNITVAPMGAVNLPANVSDLPNGATTLPGDVVDLPIGAGTPDTQPAAPPTQTPDTGMITVPGTGTGTGTSQQPAEIPLYGAGMTQIRMVIGSAAYTINGAPRQSEVAPFIRNDRTMVPLRVISEALGAEVSWDAATRTVSIDRGGRKTSVTIGQALPNNMGTAIIEGERTFVPIAYISEQLGATVVWDPTDRSVTIRQ